MSLAVRPSHPLRAALLVGAVLLAAATTATAADGTIAEHVADAIAEAQRPPERPTTVAPEVSAVRTRLSTTMVPAM